jgi:hypothetical protein
VPREESAASLAESEMSLDAPDSHVDDSEASDGDDVADWDPQPGGAPPMAPGVTNIAEGMLDADVKEVYSRLLADQVGGLQSAPSAMQWAHKNAQGLALPHGPSC